MRLIACVFLVLQTVLGGWLAAERAIEEGLSTRTLAIAIFALLGLVSLICQLILWNRVRLLRGKTDSMTISDSRY
jgi:hypothetical protein